jgi:tRNA (mo5U34)-methyltransferase
MSTETHRAAKPTQEDVDRVRWYHEFEFPGGIKAHPGLRPDELGPMRRVWAFIRKNLGGVDFRGKTVLDVGAWDGCWSFEAERRGAREVLASDDLDSNWSDGAGIHLAKALLSSRVEVDQRLSVYDLPRLGRRFDVILFLGVFYHLHAPFLALAQLRHCCHPGTVMLVEGSVAESLPEGTALYQFAEHGAEWLPTRGALRQMLGAAYFEVVREDADLPGEPPPMSWRRRLATAALALGGSRAAVAESVCEAAPRAGRAFFTCRPFEGENEPHHYRPPFGLGIYDPRFRAP